MDFIGRIKKKKAHLCKKKKKMAPENLLLEHRFQAKKKTNNQSRTCTGFIHNCIPLLVIYICCYVHNQPKFCQDICFHQV